MIKFHGDIRVEAPETGATDGGSCHLLQVHFGKLQGRRGYTKQIVESLWGSQAFARFATTPSVFPPS